MCRAPTPASGHRRRTVAEPRTDSTGDLPARLPDDRQGQGDVSHRPCGHVEVFLCSRMSATLLSMVISRPSRIQAISRAAIMPIRSRDQCMRSTRAGIRVLIGSFLDFVLDLKRGLRGPHA